MNFKKFKKIISFIILLTFIAANTSYASLYPDTKIRPTLRPPLIGDRDLTADFNDLNGDITGQAKGKGVTHRGINSINEAIRIAYDASTNGENPDAFLVIQENGSPVDGIEREHAIIVPITLKAIDRIDGRSLNGIIKRLEKNLSIILRHEIKLR